MIFNNVLESAIPDLNEVQESAYDLGIEGALMHVWENECNYNAIMQAVGLSELKYFKETGGDLLITESKSFSGFIDKIIAFFKAAIEKIQAVFKKFMAWVQTNLKTDKGFVTKYGKKLSSVKTIDFEGYSCDGALPNLNVASNKYNMDIDAIIRGEGTPEGGRSYGMSEICSDIAGVDCDGLGDMGAKIKDNMLGNKASHQFKVSQQLEVISSFKEKIKTTDNSRKTIISGINAWINKLERAKKTIAKSINTSDDTVTGSNKVNNLNSINTEITYYKDIVSALTTAFGAVIEAYKIERKQAKAICIKGLAQVKKTNKENKKTSTNESVEDLFASVEIL